jgi:stress response protein YsnF
MNWDQNRADYYYHGISQGGALVSVSGSRTAEARSILERAGGDLRESGFESIPASQGTLAEGERQIQLRGEVLRTYKERVQRGEVRLRKEVVTENQTVSAPLREKRSSLSALLPQGSASVVTSEAKRTSAFHSRRSRHGWKNSLL